MSKDHIFAICKRSIGKGEDIHVAFVINEDGKIKFTSQDIEIIPSVEERLIDMLKKETFK